MSGEDFHVEKLLHDAEVDRPLSVEEWQRMELMEFVADCIDARLGLEPEDTQ